MKLKVAAIMPAESPAYFRYVLLIGEDGSMWSVFALPGFNRAVGDVIELPHHVVMADALAKFHLECPRLDNDKAGPGMIKLLWGEKPAPPILTPFYSIGIDGTAGPARDMLTKIVAGALRAFADPAAPAADSFGYCFAVDVNGLRARVDISEYDSEEEEDEEEDDD